MNPTPAGLKSDPPGTEQVPQSGTMRERGVADDERRDPWDDAVEAEPPREPVPPEVLAAISREALKGVLRSVVVQWGVSLAVALIALLASGMAAGVSALVGAAAYAVPNTLLAFKLLVNAMRPGGGGGATVLVGEFVKMGAVVLLLALTAKLGGALIVWPALLAGLIAALKSYWVMLVLAGIRRDESKTPSTRQEI